MLLDLFLTFMKIGAFTLGGGFAMIPLIQREVVDNRNWIGKEEFMDIIAIAQSFPGSIAANISIYIGYKLKGIKGAIACVLAVILPSFFTILIIALYFLQFKNNVFVIKMFSGVRPVVVALIFSASYQLWKTARFGRTNTIKFILTILAVVYFKLSSVYLLLIGGIGFIIQQRMHTRGDSFMD